MEPDDGANDENATLGVVSRYTSFLFLCVFIATTTSEAFFEWFFGV